ncbi:MAG: hypothetical protein ACRD30_00115 [Bryobacteraceae bacterium]
MTPPNEIWRTELQRVQDVFEVQIKNTQRDIASLHSLIEKLAELDRAHTDQRVTQLHDQLLEAAREMQTEVPRAFRKWASPVDIKVRYVTDRKHDPPH